MPPPPLPPVAAMEPVESNGEQPVLAPHLPVDVLSKVLSILLDQAAVTAAATRPGAGADDDVLPLRSQDEEPLDYRALMRVYDSFSRVNRSFLAAARSTPLRLAAEERGLPRAARGWICRNTICELLLHTGAWVVCRGLGQSSCGAAL